VRLSSSAPYSLLGRNLTAHAVGSEDLDIFEVLCRSSLECAGRAQRRRRFGSERQHRLWMRLAALHSPIQSGVALPLLPHSKECFRPSNTLGSLETGRPERSARLLLPGLDHAFRRATVCRSIAAKCRISRAHGRPSWVDDLTTWSGFFEAGCWPIPSVSGASTGSMVCGHWPHRPIQSGKISSARTLLRRESRPL